MKPFARKMVLPLLGLCLSVLLVGGLTAMIYFHGDYRLPCEDVLFSDSTSPDGRWSAAVIEKRCSRPFVVHVNLRRTEDPIDVDWFSGRIDEGKVFSVEQDPAEKEPTVEWNSGQQLTIHCPSCRNSNVRLRQDHWGQITLQYKLSSQ